MCQHILGRQIATVTITGSAQLLVGSSRHRWALSIYPGSGGDVTIGFIGKPVFRQGPTLYAKGPPLLLTYEDYGEVIRDDVYVIGNVGGDIVSALDIFVLQYADGSPGSRELNLRQTKPTPIER